MRRFWVIFSHGPDGKEIKQAMDAPTSRHVAAEIRRKYRQVEIRAIKARHRVCIVVSVGEIMAKKTKIEWADLTINPIIGCTKCSPGCDNCYAERMAARLAMMPATADRYRPWFLTVNGTMC